MTFVDPNGLHRIVNFYSRLSYDGIHVTVEDQMTPLERKAFTAQLKRERDVVSISYQPTKK